MNATLATDPWQVVEPYRCQGRRNHNRRRIPVAIRPLPKAAILLTVQFGGQADRTGGERLEGEFSIPWGRRPQALRRQKAEPLGVAKWLAQRQIVHGEGTVPWLVGDVNGDGQPLAGDNACGRRSNRDGDQRQFGRE